MDIPGDMLSHLQHAPLLAVELHLQIEVAQRHRHALPGRGRCDGRAGHGGGDFPKKPGVALGCAAHDHAVTAGFIQHAQGVRSATHVTVAQHGDGHRRFHPLDDGPVRLPGILLHAGAGVYRHGPRAVGLANPGDLGRVDGLRVPAGSDLHRHRQGGGLHRGAHHPAHALRVAHHGAALAVTGDLWGGAAEVDVDKLKAGALKRPRRGGHVFRLAAEELQARRALAGQSLQKIVGVSVPAS